MKKLTRTSTPEHGAFGTRLAVVLVSLGVLGGAIVGFIAIQGTRGPNVVAQSISHDISPVDGAPIDLNSTFLSSNPNVYSRVVLSSPANRPYNVTWQWITPQETVYRVRSTISPSQGDPRAVGNLSYVDSVRLNGAVAGELLGYWRITVFIDGKLSVVQRFSVDDPTVPAQPVRPVPWPSKTIEVRVPPDPTLAHDAVVAALAQWSYGQSWFQTNFPHSTPWTYQFVLTESGSNLISVTFNQTVTSGFTSDSSVRISRASVASPWTATCAISLVLSLRNGTALNRVFIENSAMLQIGHCLGLGPVSRSGDLMNSKFSNVYDLNSPSTLNLYALDKMVANNGTANPPGYYYLPQDVPYAVSPAPPGPFPVTWVLVLALGGLGAVALIAVLMARRDAWRSPPPDSD